MYLKLSTCFRVLLDQVQSTQYLEGQNSNMTFLKEIGRRVYLHYEDMNPYESL